jgi:hypothetical protein
VVDPASVELSMPTYHADQHLHAAGERIELQLILLWERRISERQTSPAASVYSLTWLDMPRGGTAILFQLVAWETWRALTEGLGHVAVRFPPR